MSNPALDGALAEAELGAPIFPIRVPIITHDEKGERVARCSCPKGDKCPNIGKHPHVLNWTGLNPSKPVGHSTDPAQIERWARKWPDCNWGGVTGERAGRVVIDIDPRAGGDDALVELERELGPLTETRTYRSGRGGTHYVFAYPSEIDGEIGTNAGELAIGVDVRGHGGMGILPGSVHENGNRYELVDDLPLADLPEAWVAALISRELGEFRFATRVAPPIIPEGGRNDALTREAGRLRRFGWTSEEMAEALGAFNRSRCVPPLPESEVRAIATSVARYEPAIPVADVRLPDEVAELTVQLRELKAQMSAEARIRRNPGLGAAKPLAQSLPNILASVSEREEPDEHGLYPCPLARLAEQAGVRKESTVSKHLKALKAVGAVRCETVPVVRHRGGRPRVEKEIRIGWPDGCTTPAALRERLATVDLDRNHGGPRTPRLCPACQTDLNARGAGVVVIRTVACRSCGLIVKDETTVHSTDADHVGHATPKPADPPELRVRTLNIQDGCSVEAVAPPGHGAPVSTPDGRSSSGATVGGGTAPVNTHLGSTKYVVAPSTHLGCSQNPVSPNGHRRHPLPAGGGS
jgi:hypothetical protein